jgi:Flp pilus assembly protein TadG
MTSLPRSTTWRIDGKPGEQGQSLTELALMLPLLLLIVMGTLDLGRAFFAYISVINASREGARYGAMYPTDTSGITTHAAREATGDGLTLSNVSVSCPGGACTTGNPIQVTVRFTFQLVTTSLIGLGAFPMQASTQMVVFGQ